MELSFGGVILAVSLLLIISVLWVLVSDLYTWYHLPPGPLPLPFIGNKIPGQAWHEIASLHKKYGPIFTYWVGRSPRIVVSDPKIAHNLMAMRGSKYSSREQSVVFGQIYIEDASMIGQRYGPTWVVKRKLLGSSLNSAALGTFQQREDAEASKLVWDILVQPKTWNSAMLRHRLEHVKFATQLLRPGRFLTDSYPILRYLPFSSELRSIKEKGQILGEFDQKLVDTVVGDLKANGETGRGSLAEYMLKARQNNEHGINRLTPRQFSGLLGTIFSAGTDTTHTALQNAVLALVTHPNAVEDAHKDIDEIIGNERTPTFTDQNKLLYVNAIIQESIRWRPVLGLSIPHATSDDDVYDGFKIPKGTPIIANTWAINNLAEYFPRSTDFLAERFLPPSHPLHDASLIGNQFPGKYQSAVFGWGRRACPGAELSLSEQFIALAKMLWAFDITAVEGKKYDIGIESFEGVVTLKPRDFEAVFTIRSNTHKEVLEKELKEAEIVMERFLAFE